MLSQQTLLQESSKKPESRNKKYFEVIAKSLVEHPDEVVVTENEKEDAVIIELKVGPSDMGKVIGRQGRIAKAIRTVVKAASSKSSKKVIVDILQ